MDPKLKTYLDDTATKMKAAGKSDDEIKVATKELFDQYTKMNSTETPKQEVGALQGVVQEVAKPFLKAASTVRGAKASIADMLINNEATSEEMDRIQREGYDYGYLGQDVRPLGAKGVDDAISGKDTWGNAFMQGSKDAVGTGAEIGSYFFAPAKVKGFWQAAKAAVPMATTYGTGRALQASADGKDPGDALSQGVFDATTAALGYGLVNKAGNFVANFGKRALQSPAFQAVGQKVMDFAEKTYTMLPEAFTEKLDTALTQATGSMKRTVNVLKNDFNKLWKESSDSAIDATTPNVNNPDLALSEFQGKLSERIGKIFGSSKEQYDLIKSNPTKIDNFSVVKSIIDKAPESMGAMKNMLKASYGNKPKTLGNILQDWETIISQSTPDLPKEQQTFYRELAAGLYADAKNALKNENPELLKQWDGARQLWLKSMDLFDSSAINTLKKTGDVDSVVDNMMKMGVERPEMKVVTDAVQQSPEATNLFINSLLRKAKGAKTAQEGGEIIQKFLNNWEGILAPEQTKFLDDLSNFMTGTFDEFVQGQRALQGLTPETNAELMAKKGQMEIADLVQNGKFDDIYNRFSEFAKNTKPGDMITFSPQEKEVIGMSMVKDLLDEKLNIGMFKDGKLQVTPEYTKALMKTWEKIQSIAKKPEVLDELMTKRQQKLMQEAYDTAMMSKDLAELPASGIKKIMHGAVAAMYFAKGLFAGTAHHVQEAVSDSKVTSEAFYKAIDKAIEEGLVQKNGAIKVGDLIQKMTRGSGQLLTETIQELTGKNK